MRAGAGLACLLALAALPSCTSSSSTPPTPGPPASLSASLRGVLVDQQGQPVPSAELWLLRETAAGRPGVESCYLQEADASKRVASTRTRRDGSFRFERIPFGDYWVSPPFGAPPAEDGLAPVSSLVHVSKTGADAPVTIRAWRGLLVRGTLQRPDGTPAGAERIISGFSPERAGFLWTKSDPQGAFALGPLAAEQFYVVASGSTDDLGSDTAVVDAGASDVVLRLREGARVSGSVVGPEGRPIPGAIVGSFWSFDDNPKGGPAPQRLTCDENGRFEGCLGARADDLPLIAYSEDRSLAGFVEVPQGSEGNRWTIHAQPAVRVRGRVKSSELGGPLSWFITEWTSRPGGHRFAQCASRDGAFDLLLPSGDYELEVRGQDVRTQKQDVTVSNASPALDLGEIDLPATFLGLHKGKPLPPWKVTAARGVPLEKSAIADFRGKWLLVEFWGYW